MTSKSSEAKVGVAIVSWNNETIIGSCLTSIQNQTYKNIETIVLDNASADNTLGVIRQDYPWVRIIESSENTGFSKGNNTIIKTFMSEKIDYIVLLNSDATLENDWVKKLVDFANKNTHTAALQGLTLDYYDHQTVDSTHIYINQKGQAIQSGYRLSRENITKSVQKVFGVNAAACMISADFLRSQPFDYVFDEDFFMYLEDVDFAARTFVMGWDNYYVPSAVAYHMGSASSGKNPGFSVYMVNRNRLPLLVKNMPLSTLIKITPRMLKADIIEMYRIGRGRKFSVLKKFIQGRLKGVTISLHYASKRRLISKHRKLKPNSIWAAMVTGVINN
jgi:GT2 family glycosyltransferase